MPRVGTGPAIARDGIMPPTETPLKGLVAPRPPSIRSSQPVRRLEPGAARSRFSIAEKCERFGAGWPAACIAPNVLGLPERQQRRERRVQAETGVAADELGLRHRDAGPGRVVGRVPGGHDGRQAVEAAAQRQHHQHIPVVPAGGEGHLGGEQVTGETGDRARRAGGGGTAQNPATRHRRPMIVRAATAQVGH
nr:hypothetical protein GCM10020092_028980 [Actinoplanes digitatis]